MSNLGHAMHREVTDDGHTTFLSYIVIGKEGAVVFTVMDVDILPHRHGIGLNTHRWITVDAAHLPNRDQKCVFSNYQHACQCDGTMIAEDWLVTLVAEGEEALWKRLEARYDADLRPKVEQ